jgi:hypothetical protein
VYLQKLHESCVSYQHDGAIIQAKLINKVKSLSDKLEVGLKPMSNIETKISYNNVLLYNQAVGNETIVVVDGKGFAEVINSKFPINTAPSDEIAEQQVFKSNCIQSIETIKCNTGKAYAMLIQYGIKSIKDEYKIDKNDNLSNKIKD